MYSLNHKTPTTEGGAERPSGEISSSVKKVQRLVLYPNGRGATGFVPPNEATNANKKAPQHNSPPRKPFHNGTTLTPIPHPADPAFSTFLHEIQDKLETMHTDIKRLRDVSPSAESKKKHGSPRAHEKHEKQPVPPPGKPRKPTITSNASSGKFRLTSQSLNGSRSALLSDAARETKRSDSQGAGSQFSLNVETLDSPNASGSSSGSSSTSSSPTSGEAEVAKKAASPTTNNNTAAAAILPPVPSIVNKMGASLVPNAPKAAAPADGRTGFGFTGIISPTASPKGARVRGVALVNSPPPGSPPAAKPILDTAAAAGHADPSADDVKPMICDDRGVGDGARAVDGLTTDSRRLVEEAKKARMAFFSAFPRLSDVVSEEALKNPNYMDDVALPGAPCSWLCCMALAISYVTGVPTTIEKILRTNRLGIHFIALPAVTLAELYDHTNDYIHTCFHKSQGGEDDAQAVYGTAAGEFEEDEDAARCLKSGELSELVNTHCEMATFHSQVACDGVDDDAVLGMGEHVPIASLADFRKELATCAGETKSIYIFNYDPYIIEEHEVRMRSNMAETEEEAAQIMATMRYQPRSKGSFGILLDFNPVQHVAKILTPHLTSAQYPLRTTAENATLVQRFGSVYEHLVLEVHTISMQTLYESVTQIDPYSRLPRGFVRVFNNVAFINKPPSVFPLFVVDGSSSGGLTTSVLDVTIAPHILGLAMLHHLAVTFLLSDNARRKQSSRNLLSRANVCDVKLRGIPLTKICQQLGLPISMIVGDSKRSSLATVFVWYYIFLQQLQINQDVRLGLILAQRRDGSSDGMPNISEEEFLAHLQLAISTGSVMLLSFDINLATNCTISNKAEPAHFAILIGLNEESGIVRLADVNVKRFRKNWHVPISRLYNATMGYGYMMAARDKKTISALKGKAFQDEVLHCAKYFLPPQTNMIQRFEYPTDAYAITVLADAMEQLGLRSTVERLLNYSGFHISFFLSKHLPLEGAAIVAQNYSHHAVEDQLSVVVTHYDYHAENPAPGEEDPENPINMKHRMRTVEDLEKDVRYALDRPDERKLVLKYDREVLMAEPSVFNGSDGGSYAIVLEYSESTRIVKLMDCNPCSFYRVFACPLELMFRALCSYDQQDLRARGSLFLTKEYGQEANYENTKGYDMAHCQVHHPFKPIFSAWCSCIALAATEMMMNIETPLLLCGAPLGVEEDQRKKYRRYNNVFSAEDILYTTGEFSVHEWRTRALLGENMVHFTNAAFSKLRLPLVAMDMLERHPEARKDPAKLLEACGGISGLLTITIVLYDTDVLHGVPGSSAGVVNRVEEFGEHALNRTYNASHDHSEENSLDCSRSDSRRQMMQLHQNSVGSVQLVEGNPCCWGQFVDRTVEELMPAIISIICIHEFSEEDQVVL